jgi:branched-chain amino acid transport system substrate-binding protein
MRHGTRIAPPLALVASCVALAACSSTPGPAGARPGPAVHSMAFLNSDSGPISVLDEPAERGVRLAVTERERAHARDRRVAAPPVLRIHDTPSTRAGAARAAAAALAPAPDGTPAACVGFGISDTDLALGGVPPFSKAGVPFLVLGATAPSLPYDCGTGTFLACYSDDAQGRAAADFAHGALGKRTAIVLDSRSAFARTVSGYYRQRFRELGGDVVQEFDLAATPAVQLGAFLAGSIGRVDLVYVACEPGDVGPSIAAVRSVMPAVPVLGADSFDSEDSMRTAGKPSDRVWFTTHAWFGPGATPEALAFAAAYERAYGAPPPNAFAALGYDAANIVMDAVAKAASVNRAGNLAVIRDSIATTRNHRGASGTVDFRSGPIPAKDVWVVEVSQGTRRLARRVEPVPAK